MPRLHDGPGDSGAPQDVNSNTHDYPSVREMDAAIEKARREGLDRIVQQASKGALSPKELLVVIDALSCYRDVLLDEASLEKRPSVRRGLTMDYDTATALQSRLEAEYRGR